MKIDPRTANKDQPLSKFVGSTSYIKLELTENSVIGGVSDIIVNGDRILILDTRTHSVFSFNRKGKFQFRIRNVGLGPGEYQRINQFDFNSDTKEIVIGTVGKIIFFDLEGNFKKEIKTMLGGAKRMKYLGNAKYAYYTKFITVLPNQNFHDLLLTDSNMNVEFWLLPYDPKIQIQNVTGLWSNFSRFNEQVLLARPYDRKIWQIDGGKVSPRFQIDFGKHNLPEDYEESVLTKPGYGFKRVLAEESKNSFARLSGGPALETEEFLYFTYRFRSVMYHSIFDKVTGKSAHFKKSIENDLDGDPMVVPMTTYEKGVVSTVYPDILISYIKRSKHLSGALKSIADELTLDDNPVVRLTEFKRIR